MTPARQKELTIGKSDAAAKLTEEEWLAGYHWCREWDDLVIGPGSEEWGDDTNKCRCGYIVPFYRGRE